MRSMKSEVKIWKMPRKRGFVRYEFMLVFLLLIIVLMNLTNMVLKKMLFLLQLSVQMHAFFCLGRTRSGE